MSQPDDSALRDAIGKAYDAAMNAVNHVGTANYAHREREARGWVRAAFEAVDAAVDALSDTPQAQSAALHSTPAPLTDEEIERTILAALAAIGRHDAWDALTYAIGQYEISKVKEWALTLGRALTSSTPKEEKSNQQWDFARGPRPPA